MRRRTIANVAAQQERTGFFWGSLKKALDDSGRSREEIAQTLGLSSAGILNNWLYGEFSPPLTRLRALVELLSGDVPGGTRFRYLAAELLSDAPARTRRQVRAEQLDQGSKEQGPGGEERDPGGSRAEPGGEEAVCRASSFSSVE